MDNDDVLKELDWDVSNIALPVANADNKVLEEAVASKTAERNRLQNELSENSSKVNALQDHIKNVRDELLATQSLLNARKHELETEKHLNMIAERESGRLGQELKSLGSELVYLKERRNLHENEIFLANQEFDAMKSQMKWDQQALEAWLEESAQKDEDAITLQKYAKQDEGRIKELLLKIEKLEEQAHKQKKLVDEETLNTITIQVELDKTAEDFRKTHKERQELIKQWEQIIEQMQKRDNEIDSTAQKLMKLNFEIKSTKDELDRQKKFFEDQKNMNADLERTIGLLDQSIADLNLKLNKEETNRLQFHDELGALRRTVERTSHDLEKGRSELNQIKRNINEKKRYIDDLKTSKVELIDQLKITSESKYTAEENAKKMEELFLMTKQREQGLIQAMKKRSETQYKVSQNLYNLKTMEKNFEAEISGCEAIIRSLENHVNKLDHESLKQAEVIYTQDFNIQSLERRINRLQGEKSNDEQLVLQRKIEELRSVKGERENQHELLLTQFKRVEDETRKTKREMDELLKDKSYMSSKIAELTLHIDTAQRLLKKLVDEKQNTMVDENIMKLEIKKLKQILEGKADEVLDLNKRRIQLEMAMRERRSEITIHQDLLHTQMRSWEEEVNTVSAELQERIAKIDKLKKRYDICMVSMAPPEGTPPEENSQAYYVIKAAQEKEELQREGDVLNERIKKAEKELRALENTLKVVDSKNNTMKQSFNKVGDQSDLILQKEELEEQLRSLSDKYKQKRREMKQLQEDLRNMEEALGSLIQDENTCEETINEKTNKILQLDKDLRELSEKLERANKQLFTLVRDLRRARNLDEPTIEEKDFKAKDLLTFNVKKSKELISISEQYPLLRQTLQILFQQANIPIPNSSQQGSQAGSSRSSRVSSRHTSLSSASSASSFMQSPNKNIITPVTIGFDLMPAQQQQQQQASSRSSGATTPKSNKSTK